MPEAQSPEVGGPDFSLQVHVPPHTTVTQVPAVDNPSADEYKALLESLSLAIWETDPNGAIRADSPRWRTLTGQTLETWLNEGWLPATHPDETPGLSEQWHRALRQQVAFQADARLRTAGGDWRWTSIRIIPVRPAGGPVRKWTGMLTDAGERYTRQLLAESQTRWRSLVAEMPVAAAIYTGAQHTIEVANELMLRYWGKDDSVLGKPLGQAIPKLNDQGYFRLMDEAYRTGEAREVKAAPTPVTVDGVSGTCYYDFSFKPLRDASGQVHALLNVAIDVTEQLQANRQLAESEQFSRNVFYNSPVAKIVFVGEEMVIRTINENMLSMLGRDESIIGRTFTEALPELVGIPLIALVKQVFRTGETLHQSEAPIDLIRYGQPYRGYYNYIYKALHNSSGERYGVMVTATEVTELVKVRQEIEISEARYRTLSAELDRQVQLRTEQLQATVQDLLRSNQNLEQFAYIASHDLQEPLRKIQSFSTLLQDRYGNVIGDEGRNLLGRMATAGSRMSVLIRDLLTFSRISTGQAPARPVALMEVVRQSMDNLSASIDENNGQIQVGKLPVVEGDAMQLEQLFQNLLSNALKFHQANRAPVVRISASMVRQDELPGGLRPSRMVGAYHCIEVTDNGIGFDPRYNDRIFQVFQRLHGKNEFAGTGIGLAICQKVVTNHGGVIGATSQPGQGATFSVYLPA